MERYMSSEVRVVITSLYFWTPSLQPSTRGTNGTLRAGCTGKKFIDEGGEQREALVSRMYAAAVIAIDLRNPWEHVVVQ